MDIAHFTTWYTLPPGVADGDQIQRLPDLEAPSESLANLLWPLAAQNNRSQLQLHHACGGAETHLQEQSGMRKYPDDRRMFVECKGSTPVLGMPLYKNNEFLKKQWDRNYPCYTQTLLTFLLNIPLAADFAHKSESNPNENHCFTRVFLSKTISLTCHCFCIEINR